MIFLRLIWSYLKIGLFGFGGGYAMLSLIENEIVDKGWISERLFTDIVAVSQMTPGPIGINSATYIGYVAPGVAGYEGWWWGLLGATVCSLVVVLPSFFLVIFTGRFIRRHKESAVVKGVFKGLRPVIVGLIAAAALLLMNTANFGSDTRDLAWSISICACAFCSVYFFKIHPIITIIAAAIVGLIVF